MQLNFHNSLCPIHILHSEMAANNVEVGAWGGKGGYNPWIFQPDGKITEIRIRFGNVVDSIRFTFTDNDHVKHNSHLFGGDNGLEINRIAFADEEYLTGISGTFGDYHGVTVIKSLSFHTNKHWYGPHGTSEGTTFSLLITKGKVVGFSGNYGEFLESVGVILHP